MKNRVVIIGASITGINVVSELVKNKFDGEITIIDKKNVYPYNPYPLSKEWMMDMDDMNPPFLKKDGFFEKNNINLKLNTIVESVNPKDKTVTTNHNETIPYDKLVIATGSKLRKVDLPGDDAKGIFYLREFNDARNIKEWLKSTKNIAIIGAGFIGLEFSSTFTQLGKNVSVLVRSGRPLDKILGEELSEYFTNMHQSHGVNFLFNEDTQEFIKGKNGNIESILTKSGKTIKCDMVIISVGVQPNIPFEIESLDVDKGIIVNEYGETSVPDIYAGGDVVMWPYKNHLIHIEHWENAWSQGISIARNILNEKSSKYTVNPYFWTDEYDQTFEYLGNARSWDKIFIRGSLNEKHFAVAYVDSNNYPLAILFANNFEKREDIERLINENKPLDEAKFTDVNIPINEM